MAKTVSASTSAARTLQVRHRFLFGQSTTQPKRNFKPYELVKRSLDLVFAATGLLISSPILMLVALAIKLDSPGPVIFRQKRTGKDGKEFSILKFRTMVNDNDIHDNTHENQCTKVGQFLRSTSIDELPQLINILRGDMSFIGPRPWVPEYYQYMTARQRGRCKVLPGITGLAQVKGRNNIDIFKKINYDLKYVKDYSFIQDLSILIQSIKVVISRNGASSNKKTIHCELAELKERQSQ